MSVKFKLNAISVAVLTSFIGVSALAQETNTQTQQANADETIEVIEVKGFKSSLQKAMNAKRFGKGVSDSIHAEDVGKSTDQNIADALSRITGVTVQEEAGEGTRISVRGAGPSLNQVSMNGVALTGGLSTNGGSSTATNDNSVDLSSFSSDILSSIDVIKTASSDQDEGSLGANVILRTVKPLSLNKPRRSFTIEGRHDEFSAESTPKFTVSVADKLFNDKFGFVITASQDSQKTRQDRINTNWADGAISIDDLSGNGRTATDLATGKPIRVLGYQRDADGNLLTNENGKPLVNSIDTLADWDPDTQTLVPGDLFVLARETVDFSLNTDKRDRFSISTGLQYQPSDRTNIQLDVTHTKQDVYTDWNQLRMNISPVTPLINPLDDNTALNIVDLSTNTLERSTSRSITGNFNRATGLREIETNVASLDFSHDITDTFSMSLVAGFSETTDETPDDDEQDRFISISTATWGTAGRNVVEGMPDDILELVGYDCTMGSLSDCQYTTGTQPGVFDAFDGSSVLVTSRFNPFDLEHNHLGSLNLRKNKSSDTNKSLFLDFDWELDNDYVTSIEFGAKWSDRVKDVSIQNRITTNGTDLIDVNDPSAAFEVRGLATIRLADMMSGDAFPYDDFASDIQSDRSTAFFQGWPMLDAVKALEVLAGADSGTVGLRESNDGTREIGTETKAAYAKANFEFMDGRLTGNVGIRYVRDESEGTGVGGINFIRFPQMLDPYNLLVERGLANTNLPACPEAVRAANNDTRYTPSNDDALQDCWSWVVTHAYNFNNASTIPFDVDSNSFLIPGEDGQTGLGVNQMVFVDAEGNIVTNGELPTQIYNQSGSLVNTTAANWARFNSNGFMWPFLDRTTSFTGPAGTGPEVQRRVATVTNNNVNDVWLPSLNVNYAYDDETIIRFAASKTMTRPRFDSLNPRTTIFENQWDAARGSAGNTKLKPLVSTNLDFSYEWYFNPSSIVSVALFYKDMKNFEENVTTPYHYKDVRTQYDLQSADLLLDFDANRTPGDADTCMPLRQVAGFFTQWRIECDVANINTVKNGKGASIKGLEFGYTQSYDFLPGVWSGLGASINYTYQDSESDPAEIGSTGLYLKTLPQAYTPKHSANTTVFWEKDGLMLRLANRYNDVQLVNRGLIGGATWQEATNRLDFSSSYRINQNFSVTFQATNLTNDTRRTFFTSANTRDVGNPNSQEVVMDEGNVIDGGNVTTSRTASVFKTGRQFRIGIRGTF